MAAVGKALRALAAREFGAGAPPNISDSNRKFPDSDVSVRSETMEGTLKPDIRTLNKARNMRLLPASNCDIFVFY
jgi:hypothetical protein